MQSWEQADLLLTVGSRFDLRPVLDRASDFLAANVDKLTASNSSSSTGALPKRSSIAHGYVSSGSSSGGSSRRASIQEGQGVWKWLHLADELRLTSCIPALVKRAVGIDRKGCRNAASTQGLSAATLQQMVTELATPSASRSSLY